jgi:hypothetical protein
MSNAEHNGSASTVCIRDARAGITFAVPHVVTLPNGSTVEIPAGSTAVEGTIDMSGIIVVPIDAKWPPTSDEVERAGYAIDRMPAGGIAGELEFKALEDELSNAARVASAAFKAYGDPTMQRRPPSITGATR